MVNSGQEQRSCSGPGFECDHDGFTDPVTVVSTQFGLRLSNLDNGPRKGLNRNTVCALTLLPEGSNSGFPPGFLGTRKVEQLPAVPTIDLFNSPPPPCLRNEIHGTHNGLRPFAHKAEAEAGRQPKNG
jgi:hypothetical protein